MTVESNAAESQPETKTAEYNFAQLRKQLENERYAREQAEMRAQQYLEEKKQWEASKAKEPEEESYDEPYIDEKRLEKKFKAWEQNNETKIRKTAEEIAKQIVEEERQASFLRDNKDFDKVMTPEILQKFVDTYPEVAEGILSNMPDDFNRKKHVYKTIKSLKLHLKPEDQDAIEKKIQQNQQSGLYQPSKIAPSPYKAAGDFSKEGQKQAYQQAQELAARFSGGGITIPGMGMR